MMSKTVLVTGVGGDIGQSIIKCLKNCDIGRRIKIVGCDVDPYAAGKNEADIFFQSPWARDKKQYFSFLNELVNIEKINGIFPSSEDEIIFFNNHRKYFKSKKIELFINDSFIVKTFFDKYETIRFLKKNRLPYPQTYILNEYRKGLSFPLMIKPKKGCGGKGIIQVNNTEELTFYKKRFENAIVQEYVGTPDQEYTVGVFSTGVKTYSIAFKRTLGYGSMTKTACLIHDDKISELAEKIAMSCRLKGSINIQFRKTEVGYIPLEINPRLSSTVYFRHFFGFQDVKWWLKLLEGEKIRYRPRYENGVAVRSISEIFFCLS